MAITEHFTIFLDMSMMWDPELLAQGKTRVGFFRDKPTRFGIAPPPWTGQRHPLVRGVALLHVPHHQRLGGGRRPSSSWAARSTIPSPAIPEPRGRARGADHRLPPPRAAAPPLDVRSAHRRRERGAARRHPRRVPPHGWPPPRAPLALQLQPAPRRRADAALRRGHQVRLGHRATVHRYPEGRFGGEVVFAPRVGSRPRTTGTW